MLWLIGVLVVTVLGAGCSSAGDGAVPSVPTTDPSTVTAPTTTALPPDQTTTSAPPPSAARALVTPAGPIVPVLGYDGAHYLVHTPCGVPSSLADGRPIATADVVVDPGHGGDEEGAIGENGLKEKDLNLSVARHVRDRLEVAGYRVVLTRAADYRVTLATRAEIATSLDARAFVSVHHNAVADGGHDGPGSETYYQIDSPDSRRLAGLVYEEVVAALAAHDLDWQGDRDAGAKYRVNRAGDDYYGILRRSAGVPAVLAESAYLSNPAEAELLADGEVQRAEADAIAEGVVRFLTTDDPGSGYVEPYPRSDAAGPGGGATGCVDPPLEQG